MNVLIIKLGALGDVLRTTPLLSALKKKDPAARVTWLVDEAHRGALEGNPLIDELISFSPAAVGLLKKRSFDWAVNLDKEKEALDAVSAAAAKKKMGFGRLVNGELGPLDPLSEYAYRLGIDDELKFKKNKKTYQEISFEQMGWKFEGEDYVFTLGDENTDYARRVLKERGVGLNGRKGPLIGLNTGSGNRFAGKKLPVSTLVRLAGIFCERMGATVLLLGGKDETERNREIAGLCRGSVVNAGSHAIRDFAAIVKRCDLAVSGDTTAMHIAIAVKVPVVAYFASTCAPEIELYGRGKKVVSGISCAPCYKKICPIDEQCMKDMTAEELFSAAKEVLAHAGV
ncbi:MAG: glycosyltransferase family 9 protein [Candidatus Omnitrophica bacterium]|nr:glycosyltransferase family 9 protein [Candidatus Omnitrophota bacterium]